MVKALIRGALSADCNLDGGKEKVGSLRRKTTMCCVLTLMILASMAGSGLSISPTGAISRGLNHEGFGIELDRVCSIAERQFGGADDLNDFDSDAELYRYLKDIAWVIAGFGTRLRALKTVDPADGQVLKDLIAVMVKERTFVNRMALLAKAKNYDRVRTQLATESDRFNEWEVAISVRLLDSGLPGCSVLAQPEEPNRTASSPIPKDPTVAPVVDPAVAQELARFFPVVAGYSYSFYSSEQEKQTQQSIVKSTIMAAITGRTVVGPDSRVFGDLAIVKTKPGTLTAAFRTDFVSLLAGPKAKVEKLPSVGSFSEIYSFTDGDYDQVVVFQGDFIIELLARAAINRIPSKGFAVLLLTRIDATQVTTPTVTTPTVTTPTVTTPTVPVSPATSTAMTTPPATSVVPITTRSPSAV